MLCRYRRLSIGEEKMPLFQASYFLSQAVLPETPLPYWAAQRIEVMCLCGWFPPVQEFSTEDG